VARRHDGAAVPTRHGPQSTPRIAPLDAQPLTLTDQVVAAIRKAAHSGELAPGRLYSANQVSDLLGVSRGPVREALMRLTEAGMVRMERNRGFRIITPSPREVAEIFHLRLLLEVPATRAAAARRSPVQSRGLRHTLAEMRKAARRHDATLFMLHDREFHDDILRSGGNQRLVATVGTLRDAIRVFGTSTAGTSRSLADIADEHAPIVKAMTAGDAEGAARRMAEHITHTGRLLVAQALRADGDSTNPDALWGEVVGADAMP
jgi:DNA-binding GntR family transcriptional regulator